jgi:hypothetical protein
MRHPQLRAIALVLMWRAVEYKAKKADLAY